MKDITIYIEEVKGRPYKVDIVTVTVNEGEAEDCQYILNQTFEAIDLNEALTIIRDKYFTKN